jgi:signal transduction histidine kinase
LKSKYIFTLFIIGVLPVLFILGFVLWTTLYQNPAPPANAGGASPPSLNLPDEQNKNQTLANFVKADIEGTYQSVASLVANHSDADLDNFVKSHPGLSGVGILSTDGNLIKTVPSTAIVADPNYGTSDDFKNMLKKFKDEGGKTHLFYTQRIGYPAFIFAVPLNSRSIVQAVLNLNELFKPSAAQGGEIFLLNGDSGQYLYHSSAAKLQMPFNPNHEKWLTQAQADLVAQKAGFQASEDGSLVAVYSPLGINSFGIVRLIPASMVKSAKPAVSAQPKSPVEAVQEYFQTPNGMKILIALAAVLGWILIFGSLCFGMIMGPLRKASKLVLNAASGQSNLTTQSARAFGGDEVAQMVQASAALLQKLEEDRKQAEEEKEEALRRARSEVDAKNKDAAGQVASAQQQAQAAKNELNDKNQRLNDKLKELDAMKSMSEGLRNQAEQARAEIGRLKSEATANEEAKNTAQAKLNQTQAQLTQAQAKVEEQMKAMEARMLSAVAASSAIQVSSVRAAAIRTMADELKTTLGIIKGYVSSALGTGQGGVSEKQQEFLGMVINRSARLEKFINDLLDIYQVEIEQATAPHEEVNLAPEIEGLAFNFQPQAEVKNIRMKVEAKGTIPKVPIVRRRFNQLWNILYLQIIKDAPRGSSIPIAVEAVGDSVKVTVQDPGLIASPEALPKLFDEFYDPKHTGSPQLAGTGLKFALVKTILAAHGGGVFAEKAEPGTRLVLTFPTKVKKPGEAAPAAVAAPPAVAAPQVAGPLRPMAGIAAPKPAAPSPLGGVPKPPPPPAFGMPKPAAPAAAAGPRPAGGPGFLDSIISKVPPVTAPGLRPTGVPIPSGAPPGAAVPGLKPPGVPPAPPLVPGVGAAPGLMPPGAPATPGGSTLTPPGLKPPGSPVTPFAVPPGAPPRPPMPGAATPPTAPAHPAVGIPAGLTAGFIDSLMEKKEVRPVAPAGPGIPPAAPKPAAPPVPAVPGMGARPPIPPGTPGPGLGSQPSAGAVPSQPGMGAKTPVPPMPGVGTGAPSVPKPPQPGVPSTSPGGLGTGNQADFGMIGSPHSGAPRPQAPAPMPPGAPKPPSPAGAGMTGVTPAPPPPSQAVRPPSPPTAPGIPAFPPGFLSRPSGPGAPAGASTPSPAPPKVVPTNLKPTTPPPGILDLDNMDSMKLDSPPPKPPAPPPGAPRPPMPPSSGVPGAPMPPGAPKPPSPGVPPGGLDASRPMKGNEGEGELIE